MDRREIHPTAVIDENARIGEGVKVGPFAVIEKDVEIGNRSVVESHAIIRRYVKMGCNNRIHPQVVLGGLPQDLSFDAEVETYVEIGDGNTFREGVTVNRATQPGLSTIIGSQCYLMNNSHVAHDCQVGDEVIFATGATLGGHVRVGDKVFFGGGAMIHQFCRVGELAMIRGVTGISMDVLPYCMAGGTPVRHYRLNAVGLRRDGVDGQRYKTLSTAFRRLRKRESLAGLEQTPEIVHLSTWLAAESQRGIHAFI